MTGVQWSGAAFGMVFLLVGLAVAGGITYTEYQDRQVAESMETGTASVTSTGMESATETEDGETEVEYYPRIEYEYTVDGQTYEGWRVYAATDLDKEQGELRGRDFDSESAAQNVLDRFPSGSEATVYYDPSDPSQAFLVPPEFDRLTVLGGVAFGGLFALVGLYTAVQGLRGQLDD
ncbi:DUF3592 domain-containing protein [Haloarchaeobius sp. FL176]|uniref:DUF3592 domain-containing protein n=1 Tax=Haloarchaeobius sp. FL176 TaxID=2967129 RepID=UPI0021499052|nr:DUF3592 domain-containing protein [Haloarchaeobius sp. FL176]